MTAATSVYLTETDGLGDLPDTRDILHNGSEWALTLESLESILSPG